MWKEFRDFLLERNALALAVGVISGAALGPDGEPVVKSINYGAFGGTIIDFVIVCKEAPVDETRWRACTSAI
ncbi:MAG: hypothetical protein ACM3SQ_16535 [Betaproteobacteria bacterium]